VERQTARAFTTVGPAGNDRPGCEVDRKRRIVPGVRVRATPGWIDLERLRPVGHGDAPGAYERRRSLPVEPEGFDGLRIRFAHPDLAQWRHPSDVIGSTAELDGADDPLRGRI